MLGWTHVKRGDDSGPHDFYIRQLLDRKGIAIAGIWATATRSTVALAIFAEASADQNERDHHAPLDAVKSGRVQAAETTA